MTHLLSSFTRTLAFASIALVGAAASADDLPDTLPYGTDGIPSTPVVHINDTKPRTVDLLGGRLHNPYVPTRVQMLTEIGNCHLPVGAKYVRQGLTDPEPQVRAAAANAAGKISDPSLTADLKPLLHDTDVRVRAAAVVSGAKLGDASFIDAGLADADPSVVAAGLSVATDAHKVTAVLASASPPLVIPAIRALGRIGDASAADAVIPFLSQTVPHRVAAVDSLGQMKAASHAADVIKLLADEHPTVRRQALLALPNLTSVDDLHAKSIAALADEDFSVREAAARLLTQSPTPDALVALVANLPADSARLHAATRDALIAIGPPVVPAAEKLLADANPRRREDGSYLLGRLKSDASLDAHIALLKDADLRVVRQAAISLGQIGRKEASPALATLAQRATEPTADTTPAADAIEQAIVACAELGDASILPMCKEIMPKSKTVNASFRAAAAFAIGRLGDPADGSLNHMLASPISNIEEAGNVQLECVKALGQLKLKAALPIVGKTRDDAKYVGDAQTDWIDYWIRCRVTGEHPPLTPMELHEETMTSVSPYAG